MHEKKYIELHKMGGVYFNKLNFDIFQLFGLRTVSSSWHFMGS